MSTMNVSLPDELKLFVENRVSGGQYGSSSEYVRDLIRRDQDRTHLRQLLINGASSPIAGPAGSTYFSRLRHRTQPETA